MSRMESIMGIPQTSKKPSSLRNPRDPPAPRYINKQAAIDIARKLKLTSIGKVGLRITNKTSIDSEMMSKYSNAEEAREVSQKSIMDRRKGLEMARNIGESRVGKCIMETNDYEERRFNRQFSKLLEDEDLKKRQMTQKKREFVHQKQKIDQVQTLTRSDGHRSPLLPPSTRDGHLPNIHPVGATQQHARDASSREQPTRTDSRGRSPGYMRPLSCTRDKSHDSAVGDTERFLNSPFMRAYMSNLNEEEAVNRVLDEIQEANENDLTPPKSRAASAKKDQPESSSANAETIKSGSLTPADSPTKESKRPISQGMSLSKLLLSKRLQEIKETKESPASSRQASPVPPKADVDGEKSPAAVQACQDSNDKGLVNADEEKEKKDMSSLEKPDETPSKPPSRGKFLRELLKSEMSSARASPAMFAESPRVDGEGTATPGGTKRTRLLSIAKRLKSTEDRDGTDSPNDGNKKSKRSSLSMTAQIALMRTRTTSRKKRRAKKLVGLQNARTGQVKAQGDLMADPRFTRLANSLIPDSSGSRDLYHSKGQFALPDHVNSTFKSSQSRTKDSKFRQSRNLENLTRFEELFDSL